MSKRLGGSNFFKHNDTKKIKLDDAENTNVNDEVWGEDFNVEQVEECILQATQALKEQSFQVPSTFSDFNQSLSKFTSTQNDQICNNNRNIPKIPTFKNNDLAAPSTSKDIPNRLAQNRPAFVAKKSSNDQPDYNKKFDILNATDNVVAKHLKFKRNSSTDDFNSNQTLICKNDAKNVPEELLAEIERLKLENKKIQEKCITEEGQVSILRYQLKQTQKTVETVRMEKMQTIEKQKQEWSEKICDLNRNLNSIRSELELKNLEITSLKERCKSLESATVRKILPTISQQVEKHTRESEDSPRRISSSFCPLPAKTLLYSKNIQTDFEKIHFLNTVPCFPLQKEIPEIIFRSNRYLTNANLVPRYQNIFRNSVETSSDDSKNVSQSVPLLRFISTKMENEQPLSIEYIFSDLSKLMKLSETDIDSDSSMGYINKILCSCQEILLNTLNGLEKQKKVSGDQSFYVTKQFYTPDVPSESSLFESRLLFDSEYSVVGRQFTVILSKIVKYSQYLANYISGKSLLKIGDDFRHFTELNKFQNHTEKTNFIFLQLILVLIVTIRNRNFQNYCTGLLVGVLEVLSNSFCKTQYDLTGTKYITQILKEIVFSCPPFFVLLYVTCLIERCSNDIEFLKLFCQNSNKDYFTKEKDKVTFTEDSCLIQHFTLQLQNFSSKTYTSLPVSLKQVELFSNIIYNQYEKLKWASAKDNYECQCAINLLECYFRFVNSSILYFSNCKYLFQESKIILKIKHIFERVILMLYILSYTKGTIIFKLFTIYCQNVHILIQLQDELQFDSEFKSILRELEDDIEYQTTLKENEVFREEKSDEVSEYLLDNLTNFV